MPEKVRRFGVIDQKSSALVMSNFFVLAGDNAIILWATLTHQVIDWKLPASALFLAVAALLGYITALLTSPAKIKITTHS